MSGRRYIVSAKTIMTNDLKNAIEAILFVYGGSLNAQDLGELLDEPEVIIQDILKEMEAERRESGIQLTFFEGSVQLKTNPLYAKYIDKLLSSGQKPQILSNAAIETLAIIAYNQPCTRSDIEQVRGVNCDYTVNALVAKGLIYISGRKETVGKPLLYATSEEFLRHFGIESIEKLPKIEIELEN